MTENLPLGRLLHSFFIDYLITVKGLRPASVRSYRDTIRLLLVFASADKACKITRLTLSDLTFDRVVGFLRYLLSDVRREHVAVIAGEDVVGRESPAGGVWRGCGDRVVGVVFRVSGC